jgi:hypothetical protein
MLTILLALGAGTALVLRRLLRPAVSGAAPATPDAILAPGRSARESYRPMYRLFSAGDFSFLSGQPDLRGRLRRQRVRVMRLYLRQLRVDFEELYALARALVPTSLDSSFASHITLQALRFHGLMLAVEMRCAVGWFLPVQVGTGGLVEALDRLREAARVSLLAPQPANLTA